MRGTDLGPWLAVAAGAGGAAAARVRRGRGQADGRRGHRQAALRSALGLVRLLRSRAPTRASSSNLAEARPERAAALRQRARRLAGRPRALRAAAGEGLVQPEGRRRCRRRSSAGAWAICWPGPSWPRIMTLGRAARRSGARRRSCWCRCRPAGDRGGARDARRATPIARSPTGRRSAAARLGDRGGAPARAGDRRRRAGRSRAARARGARAGRGRRTTAACPCWATRSITASDVLLCRGIIVEPRQAPRSAGRPGADQAPARGPEPARDGGGAGRHRRSGGRRRAARAPRGDEYVPVRIAAAKALAKLGDARVAALVDEAARKEKEAAVIAAARAAATALRGKTN